MANLSSPPYMELIFIFFFCCFPVDWVVKIHAFGVLPLPVSPDQVSTHAQQGYHHYGHNDPDNSGSDCGAHLTVFIPIVLGVVAGCRT